jgi:hypothetical protein
VLEGEGCLSPHRTAPRPPRAPSSQLARGACRYVHRANDALDLPSAHCGLERDQAEEQQQHGRNDGGEGIRQLLRYSMHTESLNGSEEEEGDWTMDVAAVRLHTSALAGRIRRSIKRVQLSCGYYVNGPSRVLEVRGGRTGRLHMFYPSGHNGRSIDGPVRL